MPPFPKPKTAFTYVVADEMGRLRARRTQVAVPDKPSNRVVVGSWNIANLGVQQRRPQDYQLIAEMVSWFDVMAIQEVNENLDGLDAIRGFLPQKWRVLFTDMAGNRERLTFIYDSTRVDHTELVGEVNLLPRERTKVTLTGVTETFQDFDRSPYICGFESGTFRFTVVNVHILFGSDSGADFDRRRLEVLAIAQWAKSRRSERILVDRNVMIIGDMNVPRADADDPVYKNLLSAGLKSPKKGKMHGTAIGGHAMNPTRDYDQVVMFPVTVDSAEPEAGVFDFDSVVFPDLWASGTEADRKRFMAYLRYYLSDHRILWASFKRG